SQPGRRRPCSLLRGARHRRSALLDGKRRRVVIVLGYGRTGPAESRGAVNRTHFIHVRVVEQVESVDTKVEHLALAHPEIPRQAQIPRIQRGTGIGVSADGGRAVGDGSAVTGEGRATDTIRAQTSNVTKRIFPDVQGEGPAGLEVDNAAEFEVAEKTMFGCGRGEVRHQVVTEILVGVGPLRSVVELVGW